MTHPRVVAAFCYRYEPDEMVADALESLSWCDDVVTLCDRGHPEVWSPRADRQARLGALVDDAEPDWVFWTSPLERSGSATPRGG